MGGSAQGRWQSLLEKHASSGLSVLEFCRRNRVSQQSFYAWRRKLALSDAEQQSESPPVAFASVAVLQEEPLSQNRISSGLSITIHLAGEVRIEVAGAVDRRTLAEVLAALRASPGKEASC